MTSVAKCNLVTYVSGSSLGVGSNANIVRPRCQRDTSYIANSDVLRATANIKRLVTVGGVVISCAVGVKRHISRRGIADSLEVRVTCETSSCRVVVAFGVGYKGGITRPSIVDAGSVGDHGCVPRGAVLSRRRC